MSSSDAYDTRNFKNPSDEGLNKGTSFKDIITETAKKMLGPKASSTKIMSQFKQHKAYAEQYKDPSSVSKRDKEMSGRSAVRELQENRW